MRPRPGSPAHAKRSRPEAADPGARGGASTYISTRIRRLRQFRHVSRALGGGLRMASKGAEGADGDDQRRVTSRRILLVPVQSTPEHLGCRMVAAGGSRDGVRGRNPWKWVVAHTGFEPVLPP